MLNGTVDKNGVLERLDLSQPTPHISSDWWNRILCHCPELTSNYFFPSKNTAHSP
jgi:hypothetical protein